jgi:hypothetical protein
VSSQESGRRRRTIAGVIALAAAVLLAPLATWSAGSALGTTQQTITFGALPDRTLSQPALHVAATASSGLAVTFSAGPPEICTATGTNGANISPQAVGMCTVQADQAGNTVYAAATPVQQSFNITKGQQTITFGPLADRGLGAGAFTVSATASTGLPVTFTTADAAVCTASGLLGATITPLVPGTCTVRADQAGTAIWDAAPQVAQSFGVSKSSQAITFGALTDKSLAQSPVTVSATSTSTLPVTFTTSTTAVCTSGGANGATITLVAVGTCTVQADQPGDLVYNAAAPVVRSFNATLANQSITFGALAARTTLQSPFTVSATASSGLPVSFATTTPSVCTASGADGSLITLVGAGTCTVEARQPGNDVFGPAAVVLRNFNVIKADQTITFGPLADRTALESPLIVGATASSGLTVAFSTTTPSVCTAGGTDGATITLVAFGTCTVAADQAGNEIYFAAVRVAHSFVVTKADQTITFGPLADAGLGAPITVGATASSGLAVSFSTTTPSVCAAAGTTISLLGVGTCTVAADQPGDGVYNAAPTVVQSFGVGLANQTITFGALADVTVTHAPITVVATASSNLPVSFTTTTTLVCTAGGTQGATITIISAGTCTVQADQPGDDVYAAANTVTQSFAVTKLAQTISFGALAGLVLPHAPITIAATATSGLAVTFASTTTAVCTTGGTNGATVTLLKAGACVVRAEQPGNATFRAATPVTRQFTVTVPVVTSPQSGYWMLGADGRVYAFGGATDFGSAAAPAVAFSARRDGTGYWVVNRFGDVRAFGKAVFHGGTPIIAAGEFVSTISSTPSGNGYWLFTTLGRVFAYGDAHFYGDLRAVRLNGPVVASIATPTGRGYYMVGTDGGVFSFGDAQFHGSMGGAHLNRPIVGLSPTPDNRGYWLVASDGGVFAFGAPFRGSLGNTVLNQPVNGLVAYGNGYLMVASDGGVFTFSNRRFVGSLGDHPPAAPIVGIATTP